MGTLSDIPGEIMIRDCPPCQAARSTREKSQRSLEDLLPILKKALEFQELAPLHKRFVAAVETGLDVFLVGSAEQVEFPIYLLPLLGHIINGEESDFTNDLDQTTATPSAIVLCPSIKRGNEMASQIRESFKLIERMTGGDTLPNRDGSVKLVEYIHTEDPDKLPDLLSNGPINVLILTAPAICRIFTSSWNTKLHLNLSLQRLKYLVIEELFMKNDSYSEHVTSFLQYMNLIDGGKPLKESPPRRDLQLIFTGSVWSADTGEIHSLLKKSGRNSIKIMGSPIHAFQCSRDGLEWRVYQAKTGHPEKLKILIELCEALKEDETGEKVTVVACSSSELAQEVSHHLSKEGGIRNMLKTKDNEQVFGIFRRHFEWLGSIHVVSDDALEKLEIHNASCLIHFDIGGDADGQQPSLEPFPQKRYSCMWEKLGSGKEMEAESPLVSYFLVTGREENFPAFYKFIQEVEVKIPKVLKEIGIEKVAEEELRKGLCGNMKCFGLCNVGMCPERHEISQEDLDTTPDGPKDGGEVAFRVVHALNPSLYLGRLTKHYVFDGLGRRSLKKDYKVELKERVKLMREYYSVKRNIRRPDKLLADVMYCLLLSCPTIKSKTYVRVTLADSTSSSSQHDTGEIEVLCVDTGIRITVSTDHLLQLPEEFQRWPKHCVQVILSNLLPHTYGNNEYLSDALLAAKSLTEGKTWHGKVVLAIRDTVWINPMVQLEKDPVTGHPALGCNLICEYVNGEYATMMGTHKHLMIMLEHIRKRDPDYPETIHEFNMDEVEDVGGQFYGKVKGDQTEWLSLSMDGSVGVPQSPSFCKMIIQAWINPWEVYATLAAPDLAKRKVDSKGHRLHHLEVVESEMSKYLEEIFLPKHFMKVSTLSDIGNDYLFGTIVAVKTDIGKWHRGIILRKSEEEDVSIKFDVFLVDYGVTLFGVMEVEEVVPLLKEFVDCLPFQTVCLKLAHIQPPGGKDMAWNMNDMTIVTNVLTHSREVKVVITGKVHETTHPCNYYEAMVFPQLGYDEDGQEIGIQLVSAGQAELSQNSGDILSIIRDLPGKWHQDEVGTETDSEFDDLPLGVDIDEENGKEGLLENWENFLDENDEVEEPGPSIMEISKLTFGMDSFDFTRSPQPSASTSDYDQLKQTDSDEDPYHDALENLEDEDLNSGTSRLSIAPEEVEEMKKLCRWFLKTL